MIRRRLLNDVKIPCDQFWAGCDTEAAAEAGAPAIVRQAHLLQTGVVSPADWERKEGGPPPQHLSPAAMSDFPRSLQWPVQCGATRDGTRVLDMPEVAPSPSTSSSAWWNPFEDKAAEEKASAEKASAEKAAAKAEAREKAAAAKAAEDNAATIKAENIGWTLDPRIYEKPGQFTGCPDGQRNAAESECLAAVQEATTTEAKRLQHRDLKVVDAGADGWVPFGCSFSRGHGLQAMFNRNPTGRNWGSYPLVCIEEVQPPKANLTGVVILLGQSNMVGRGRGETLDPALLKSLGERDLGYYPANDACGSPCNIEGSDCNLPSFMQEHCRWFDVFQISEQKHQQQLRPVRGQAWEQAFLGSESRFGPELTLGLTLNIDAPSAYTRVVVIKRAVLGVRMASFGVGEPLYSGLLRDYARVADLYGPAQTVPIGVMWMQGESDSNSASDAPAYSARLRRFISRVRSDFKAPLLPFVIPQLSGRLRRPFQDQVEAAYTAAAAEVPHVRYVLGEWPTASEAQGPRATPQHLMDSMAGTGVAMSSQQLADVASEVCGHYSSSSLLRIGVQAARNMAELLGWEHQDISANVSTWVEYQNREEASWATSKPADWGTCGVQSDDKNGLRSFKERLDAVSKDGPLVLNYSSHGSWTDVMD